MTFPLTTREADRLVREAVFATMVWGECPDCDGHGYTNNSWRNDPQWDVLCRRCDGDGLDLVGHVHLMEPVDA